MPTLEDMTTVYELPARDAANYKEKVEILLWYFDSYMPAAAGRASYGPDIRWYKRATSAIVVAGKRQTQVPHNAEAFGLLVFENCISKWQHICPMKVADPSWSVPTRKKNDPQVMKYYITKWSDGKTGQVQGGGWKDEAYDRYTFYQQHVVDLRKKDKANSWAVYNLGKELMRKKNGVTAAAPKPTTNKRKHSKGTIPLAPRRSERVLKEVEEELSESDFSKHSEQE